MGFVGLPNVGTGAAKNFPFCTIEPNWRAVLPDENLYHLRRISWSVLIMLKAVVYVVNLDDESLGSRNSHSRRLMALACDNGSPCILLSAR